MTTEWRIIPEFPDYEVSSDGGVRRVGPYVGRNEHLNSLLPRPLTPRVDSHGYLRVWLRRDGFGFPFRVHTLVAMVFIGPRPPGMDACHSDGTKTNNAIENIRYDTRAGNQHDRAGHGTSNRKVAAKTAKKIAAFHAAGSTTIELANAYGLGRFTVRKIVTGRYPLSHGEKLRARVQG